MHNDAKNAAESVEGVFRMMESLQEKVYGKEDKEEEPRMEMLDEKHRNYFWAPKSCQGPPPTDSEQLEYQNDATIEKRLRSIGGASQRLFLIENDDDAYLDEHWNVLESAANDILMYPYAWVNIIATNKRYMQKSLEAVRILLSYTSNLVSNRKYQNVSKALKVLKLNEKLLRGEGKKLGGLLQTMKDETGDNRFELALQEYKQALYSCLAMSVSGQRDKSIEYFNEAINEERGYRVMSMTEYKHRAMITDPQDYIQMIQSLVGNVSLLSVVAEELGIPRETLDEDYFDLEDDDSIPMDSIEKLDSDQIWQCIVSFGIAGNTQNPLEFCETCWMIQNDLKKCSRCKMISYCGRQCQIKDWTFHKYDCLGSSNKLQSSISTKY
mmetsp:Transcript_4620/g.5349  ORF Transcript_4620/g.5349 Transcript_4620/m.5349 type:complete len:382 (+) Transcript_4620:31-1176(+)